MTEQARLDCETCGPAPVPEGQDPFQVAIAHAEANQHVVRIHRLDTISPEDRA